jgi:hypothetical protein
VDFAIIAIAVIAFVWLAGLAAGLGLARANRKR